MDEIPRGIGEENPNTEYERNSLHASCQNINMPNNKRKSNTHRTAYSAILKHRRLAASKIEAQYDERECLANALQFNIEPLIDGILFTDSELPDLLLSGECLTEDECAEIRKLNRKDQIRLLVSRIKDRNLRVLKRFLQYITEQNPSVAAKISQRFELNKQNGLQAKFCDLCKLKKQVNVKYVADKLWAIEAIPDDLYRRVIYSQSPVGTEEELWEFVIRCLNGLGKNKTKEAYATLVEALTIKKPFTHIADGINTVLKKNRGELYSDCSSPSCASFPNRNVIDRCSTTSEESTYPRSSVDYSPEEHMTGEENEEALSTETVIVIDDGKEYHVEVRGRTNRKREDIDREKRVGIYINEDL